MSTLCDVPTVTKTACRCASQNTSPSLSDAWYCFPLLASLTSIDNKLFCQMLSQLKAQTFSRLSSLNSEEHSRIFLLRATIPQPQSLWLWIPMLWCGPGEGAGIEYMLPRFILNNNWGCADLYPPLTSPSLTEALLNEGRWKETASRLFLPG